MKPLYSLLLIAIVCSCSGSKPAQRNKEARFDADKMTEATHLQQKIPNRIKVDAETTPVQSKVGEDAADDPAIWYNQQFPEKSIIIGTNKKSGLYTYDIHGNELDFIPSGKMNNVDIRSGFPLDGDSIILVAATNRTSQGISLFALNAENGQLSDQIGEIKTSVDDVYGFSLYQNDSLYYAIANGKNGEIEQYQLNEDHGRINGRLVNKLKVSSQPEGMTAIDNLNLLFVGVEEQHIVAYDLSQNPPKAYIIEESSTEKNPYIAYDIEGLAQFEYNGRQYLIASIQGNFSYALFDVTSIRKPKYIDSFILIDNDHGVDGVEETDGLEVITSPLKNYPEGILVVQDGFNTKDGVAENQNFKIIDLHKILDLIP